MSRYTLLTLLRRLGACAEAQRWARDYDTVDYEKAWAECPNASWMIWLCGRAHIERRELVLVSCAIAEDAVRRHWKGGPEPMACIETTRAWCRGEARIDQVWDARRASRHAAAYAADAAAYAAAYAAYDAAAYAADYAADAAAYAADAAAYAADYAADAAAYAAAYAAYAADYAAAYAAAADAAARREAFARYAHVVRAAIPLADVLRGLEVGR